MKVETVEIVCVYTSPYTGKELDHNMNQEKIFREFYKPNAKKAIEELSQYRDGSLWVYIVLPVTPPEHRQNSKAPACGSFSEELHYLVVDTQADYDESVDYLNSKKVTQ